MRTPDSLPDAGEDPQHLIGQVADGDLSKQEAAQLQNCERIIDRAVRAVMEAGPALEKIRAQRLYRATHATFEAYCQERWGFSRSRASRLINCAEVAQMLPTGNTVLERQLRELLPLRSEEIAVIEAWRDAQELAEAMQARLSPQLVRNAVQKRLARIAREQAIESSADIGLLPGHIRIEHLGIDALEVEPGSVD